MDRRHNLRVTALMPVRIWGVDANSLPFMQLASVRNISGNGALIQGMRRQVRPGEVLEVQMGQHKAQFRVIWAGVVGSRREGEIGVESLPFEPDIWDVNLRRCSQLVATG